MIPLTKGYLKSISDGDDSHRLEFQFNPTSIKESRSVKYNYSEAQGQHIPLAQFGMLNPTKLQFELFMLKHNGLDAELKSLRRLTMPRQVGKFTSYEQVSPHSYLLNLGSYGIFHGTIDSVEINTTQYHKTTLLPIRLEANISFTGTSLNISRDISEMKTLGGFR